MDDQVIFGVIGAMDSELSALRARLEHAERVEAGGLEFWLGTIGRCRTALVKCGVGKVRAARCAQLMIDRFAPRFLINTGIAGGVGPGLQVGDFVIGTELVQHDFDVSKFGYARGYLCTGEDPARPTAFHSDAELVRRFRRAAQAAGCRTRTGCIATGDCFVCDGETKRRIRDEFGAEATEMEGCAIAQVASENGAPFIVVRAISDLADESASVSFDTFEQQTADVSARMLIAMIEDCAQTE